MVLTIESLFDFYDIDYFSPTVKKAEAIEDYTKYDALIYFGNDTIAYYGISKNLIKSFIDLGKPIHIINTSYGKDRKNNFLRSIGKYRSLTLWARDTYSQSLIADEVNPTNPVQLCADLAHLCPDNCNLSNLSQSQSELIKWINSSTVPVIALNLHEDFGENNQYVQSQFEAFAKEHSNQFRFLFLPHDSRATRGELKINQQFYEVFRSNSYLSDVLDPAFEIYVLRKLHSVITCRMHLGILALRSGIPPIIIGYNGVKAKGLLDHWGLEKDLYFNPADSENLTDKFQSINAHYSKILTHISFQSLIVSNLAMKPISTVIEQFQKKKKFREITVI